MRIRKRPPAHLGRIIKDHHLEPLTITITDLADVLGVSRKTLSKIADEHGSITRDMALRLSRAFNAAPELWLNFQTNYDLWRAVHSSKDWKRVRRLKVSSNVQVPNSSLPPQ